MKTSRLKTCSWLQMFAVAICSCVVVADDFARAGEVQFLARAGASGPLLQLGDIAEIFSSDAKQVDALSSIELFPAPAAGRTRLLRAREIQDLLALRGVDLSGVRFGGASAIHVEGAQVRTLVEKTPKPLKRADTSQLEPLVVSAIRRHLAGTVDADMPWTAEVRLTDEAFEQLSECGRQLTATGGRPPWTGRQRFLVSGQVSGKIRQAVVEAVVSVPQSVVVAARAIPRGRVVQAADVRLEPAEPGSRTTGAAVTIDDVVGKEATRSLVAGSPVDARTLRNPIVVRRGDVLKVTVQVSNVTVTTNARAMDEGSQGDLIEVQALDSRERYVAHVTGIQQVAVYPRRIQVAPAPHESIKLPRSVAAPPTPSPVRQAVWHEPPAPPAGEITAVSPANFRQPAEDPVASGVDETGWKPRRRPRATDEQGVLK